MVELKDLNGKERLELTNKIMLVVDETLEDITHELLKEHDLSWHDASILVDECFRELCISKDEKS